MLLLQELNEIFSKPLKDLMSTETKVDDAALISIDSKGVDVQVRQGAQVRRLFQNFDSLLANVFDPAIVIPLPFFVV